MAWHKEGFIADTAVASFVATTAGGFVFVRSSQQQQLAHLLTEHGATVRPEADTEALAVTGMTSDTIGEPAGRHTSRTFGSSRTPRACSPAEFVEAGLLRQCRKKIVQRAGAHSRDRRLDLVDVKSSVDRVCGLRVPIEATIIYLASAPSRPKGGIPSMRTVRLAAAAAVFAAVLASPGIAAAATITQPFHAESGDACHYGVADGTLGWRFGAASPLPVTAVDVAGKLTDHPTPSEPVTACRDDGYYSTVTFVAYAGSVVVDSQKRSANNAIVPFSFTLGNNATTSTISHVVIQVCRGPVITLPPTYCGTPVTYNAPPVG